MVHLAVAVAVIGIFLVLIVLALKFRVPLRSGVIGLLVGVAAGFPIAFVLAFFRIIDAPIILGWTYLRHTVWLPVCAGIVGWIIGMVVGSKNDRKRIK